MDLSEEIEGKTIHQDKWHEMSLFELYDQKTIIVDRISYACSINHPQLINSLQQGLELIEYQITNKLNGSDKNNKNILT